MSNQSHTPGPWELEGRKIVSTSNSLIKFGYINKFNRKVIVYQPWLYSDPSGNESESNARLIAAAPELLEALEGILANDGSRDCYDAMELRQFRELAKTAIAKATGKEPA